LAPDADGTFRENDYVDDHQNPPRGGTWTTMGTHLVRMLDGCPNTDTISPGYSAAGATLTIYDPVPPLIYEIILTKQ
jgi:hypothetical protein